MCRHPADDVSLGVVVVPRITWWCVRAQKEGGRDATVLSSIRCSDLAMRSVGE